MQLVLAVEYEVVVVTKHRDIKCRLRYCGGSIVDQDGHFLGGGVWTHPRPRHGIPSSRNWVSFRNLHVIPLREKKERTSCN